MGRWGVRGGPDPPYLASRLSVKCARQCHLYKGTLLRVCHFQVCHFGDAREAVQNVSKPFRKPYLFELPAHIQDAPRPAQPSAAQPVGPFVHTCATRSGLNDGGGPLTHWEKFSKPIFKTFQVLFFLVEGTYELSSKR